CPPQEPAEVKQPYRVFTVHIDGPLGEFMRDSGDVSLAGDSFTLYPDSSPRQFAVSSLGLDEVFAGVGGFAHATRDTLYGAKIEETRVDVAPDGSTVTTNSTYYLYRYIAVVDPVSAFNRRGVEAP